ncbi:MAG: hypothetical protein ACK55I_26850, partial [bacterium]
NYLEFTLKAKNSESYRISIYYIDIFCLVNPEDKKQKLDLYSPGRECYLEIFPTFPRMANDC